MKFTLLLYAVLSVSLVLVIICPYECDVNPDMISPGWEDFCGIAPKDHIDRADEQLVPNESDIAPVGVNDDTTVVTVELPVVVEKHGADSEHPALEADPAEAAETVVSVDVDDDVEIPVIDISPLILESNVSAIAEVTQRIYDACRQVGFFVVTHHGVASHVLDSLDEQAHKFFALPLEEKMKIRMELGGSAWRGYFPVGGELTSGAPDNKEGIYFGNEMSSSQAAGRPLRGRNLFPDAKLPHMRYSVMVYMQEVAKLGHRILSAMARGLGLRSDYFHQRYTADPLLLFRIFHYPGGEQAPEGARWGVGEHTDYGLLTLLRVKGGAPGLQVKTTGGKWIDVPAIPQSFVINLGDMLDRLTGGLFRSTPHRVKLGPKRISFPLFFDPNLDAKVEPIEGMRRTVGDAAERWDGRSVDVGGTYGDYLIGKVSKVFPGLSHNLD